MRSAGPPPLQLGSSIEDRGATRGEQPRTVSAGVVRRECTQLGACLLSQASFTWPACASRLGTSGCIPHPEPFTRQSSRTEAELLANEGSETSLAEWGAAAVDGIAAAKKVMRTTPAALTGA